MSDTQTGIPNGAMLPIDSLPQTFTWNGNKLSYITVEYPPNSGDFYRQTFTYLPGFGIASVTLGESGAFRSIEISTGGPGQGATFSANYSLRTPNINFGGTGYTIGDILTLSGGDGSLSAQVEVTGIGVGGAVSTWIVYDPGNYTVLPAFPVMVTGGTGSGALMDARFQFLSITVDSAGAGYDNTSTMVFNGDNVSIQPTATIVLSTTPTDGNISHISGWEKQ